MTEIVPEVCEAAIVAIAPVLRPVIAQPAAVPILTRAPP